MKLKSIDQAIIGVLLAGAIATGILLNQAAFRNRKLFWRLQGGLIAGAAGFIIGRVTAKKP